MNDEAILVLVARLARPSAPLASKVIDAEPRFSPRALTSVQYVASITSRRGLPEVGDRIAERRVASTEAGSAAAAEAPSRPHAAQIVLPAGSLT